MLKIRIPDISQEDWLLSPGAINSMPPLVLRCRQHGLYLLMSYWRAVPLHSSHLPTHSNANTPDPLRSLSSLPVFPHITHPIIYSGTRSSTISTQAPLTKRPFYTLRPSIVDRLPSRPRRVLLLLLLSSSHTALAHPSCLLPQTHPSEPLTPSFSVKSCPFRQGLHIYPPLKHSLKFIILGFTVSSS